MNQIMISVIIPTYHRNDLLAQCLERCAPGCQTLPAEQYEVIVTDDGFQSTAEEMIFERYPWAKWVAGPRQGPASNRNNGAKYARGEWLFFTDDDCLPEPNWLSALAEATSGPALALEGAIHPLGDPDQDLVECPVNLTGGVFWSANIAVRRDLFEKVGGFDPDYPLAGFEDTDLKLRLDPLTSITFVPDARVFHPVRALSLKKSIVDIPIRCHAAAYHWNKHKKTLGFESKLDIAIFHFKYYLKSFLTDFRYGKFQFAFICLVMLIVGSPFLVMYLSRMPKS